MSSTMDYTTSLAYDETFACVQCGYCLPSCPTYITMKKESHSPRGRINLVKMAAEGKISIDDLAGPMELCLGCRACEPACPTNVQYGKILESALSTVSAYRKEYETVKQKTIKKVLFHHVFPKRNVLGFIGSGLHWYQSWHLDDLVKKLNLTRVLPESMREMEAIMPEVLSGKRKEETTAVKEGETRFKVAFFTGCVMDTFFRKVNDLSMKLLTASGCEVHFIEEQTCCGALHQHSGERDKAKELAMANIEAFEQLDVDFVVNSIGGCGAAMVEYHHLFEPEDAWYDRAKQFALKSKDISTILHQVDLPFKEGAPLNVAYQPSCHLTNVQRVVDEPQELISKIPGVKFLPYPDMNMCCGSAGIYNLVHYEESMEILDMKMKNISSVHPDVILTSNPGCHLQMLLGVKREGLEGKVRVMHLVELLAESCNIQ
ncbi:(Fe-S)-binding protein [Rossellomorea marisflavi]|uniref:(Fe-S)-binding protein n=1 Tax=Rossellomorea marisflavi TaxID=189381 RepID=UPI00201E0829|nr:(Fe-S)-binding protein [Rossellomorea marisflavi]